MAKWNVMDQGRRKVEAKSKIIDFPEEVKLTRTVEKVLNRGKQANAAYQQWLRHKKFV